MRTRVRDAALSEHRRELGYEPAGCSRDPGRRWTDLRRWSTLVAEKRVDEATRADPGSLSHNPRDRCAGTSARLPDAIRRRRRPRFRGRRLRGRTLRGRRLRGRTLRGRTWIWPRDGTAGRAPAILPRTAVRSMRSLGTGARRPLRSGVAVLRLSIRIPFRRSAPLRRLPRRLRSAVRFAGRLRFATGVCAAGGPSDSASPATADAGSGRVLHRPVSASRRWRRHGLLLGLDSESTDRTPGRRAEHPASATAARAAVPLDRRSGRRAPDEPRGRRAAAVSPAGEATEHVLSAQLGPDSDPNRSASWGRARNRAPCVSGGRVSEGERARRIRPARTRSWWRTTRVRRSGATWRSAGPCRHTSSTSTSSSATGRTGFDLPGQDKDVWSRIAPQKAHSLRTVHDHGLEAHLALGDAVVRLVHLGERVRLGHDLHLPLRRVVEGLVQVLAPILLRADDLDPAHDEIRRRHGSGFASKPINTKRPSGRRPAIASAIASTELPVPSTTSAPPAWASPLPSRTARSAPSSRTRPSLSGE